MSEYLRVGLSVCFLPEDKERVLFNGRMLYYVEHSLPRYLHKARILVYLISPCDDSSIKAIDYAKDLDGLVLHGGADVSPLSYHETPIKEEWNGDFPRDQYEISLVKEFVKLNKPVLGICRGLQVINVAFGGTLYQDIVEQQASKRLHRDAKTYEKNEHQLNIIENSFLAAIYPDIKKQARINSVHHQAVKDLAPDFMIGARSEGDEIIEAIKLKQAQQNDPFCVGVQWHPEFQTGKDQHLLSPWPLIEDFKKNILMRKSPT